MHKPHISFSELSVWKSCSFKHKLQYIDKIDLSTSSPHLFYGTILHEALEEYVKTKKMNIDEANEKIKIAWEREGFDSEKYIFEQAEYRKNQGWKPKSHDHLDAWLKWTENILNEVPKFLDDTFGDWELLSAEEPLYEPIDGVDDVKFKGFIDLLIKAKDKRGKDIVWLLDWKTAGSGGWNMWKKRDPMTPAQITLYKKFWRTKFDIDIKDVKCGYLLLKKGAKPGKCCELYPISVGPKTEEKAFAMVKNMIRAVKAKMYMKNREGCKFCDYKGTTYCPSPGML